MGQSFDLMPMSERARRYREMAAAACQLADDAPSFDGKANYLRLASAWHQLAVQLELEMSDIPSLAREGTPA
jgi:hypothetical protein